MLTSLVPTRVIVDPRVDGDAVLGDAIAAVVVAAAEALKRKA